MDSLYLILLGIGIVAIAAIWLLLGNRAQSRGERDRGEEPAIGRERAGHHQRSDREPTLHRTSAADDDDGAVVIRATAQREQPRAKIAQDGPEASGSDVGEMIVVLYVVARPAAVFSGTQIAAAFADLDLIFGEMDIYHRIGQNGKAVFSVVNMVNPGVFDPEAMETFTTPGVTLFAVLPDAGDGVAAFDAMLDAANGLAERLDGIVLDETRSAVTRQGCEHTREQIRGYELKLRRAHGRR